MKLRTILAVTAVALVALPMTAAHAASSSANATVSASVNSSITISFSDSDSSFGGLNPGTTTTDPDTLAYTVDTNNAAGFSVSIASGATNSFPNNVLFLGKTSGGSFTDAVNGTNSAVVNNWRTTAVAGPQSYTDSTRVIVPANAAAASYNATLVYTATTN